MTIEVKFFLGILFICFFHSSFSQNSTDSKIQGLILDRFDSSIVINNAEIKLSDTASNKVYVEFSDSLGKFNFDIIPFSDSNIYFDVSAPSYIKFKGFVGIDLGKTNNFLFELTPICTPRNNIEIYFESNHNTVHVDSIKPLFNILVDNQNLAIELIGYYSKLEPRGIGIERAKFVLDELKTLGIDEKRLSIRIDDEIIQYEGFLPMVSVAITSDKYPNN